MNEKEVVAQSQATEVRGNDETLNTNTCANYINVSPVNIPACITNVGYKFIKIHPKSKMPSEKWSENQYASNDVPMKAWVHGWQDYSRKDKINGDITHYIGWGNYGVVCSSTAIIVEVDTPEMVEYSMKHPVIGKTLRARSGSGRGNHFILRTDAGWTIPLMHPTEFDEEGKRTINVGHIKSKGSYCVGATSIHPTGNPYELLNQGEEILYVPFKELIEYYSDFILLKHKGQPEEKISYKAPVGKEGSASYFGISMSQFMPEGKCISSGDEIIGASRWHESKTGTNYRVNLKKGTWFCAHCNSGDGAIAAYAIEKHIISCGEAGPGCLNNKWDEIYRARRADGWIPPELRDVDDFDEIVNQDAPKEKEISSSFRIENDFVLQLPGVTADENIISKWYDFACATQDAYPEYHIASMLSVISHLVVGVMYPQYAPRGVKNNMMGIILGNSGCGKSISCGAAMTVMNDPKLDGFKNRLMNKFTPESMTLSFHENNRRYHYSNECVGFLKSMKKDYNKELSEDLTNAYDGESISKQTIKHGTIFCNEPIFSAMWNTTIDSWSKNVLQEEFASGFFFRPFFTISERNKEVKRDIKMTPGLEKLRESVIFDITELCKAVKGRRVVFPENDYMNDWKYALRVKSTGKEYSELERSALQRVFDQARKLAMNLTIASTEFREYVISENSKVVVTEVKKSEGADVKEYIDIQYTIPAKYAELACKIAEEVFFPNTMKALRLTYGCGKYGMLMKALEGGLELTRTEISDMVGIRGKLLDEFLADMPVAETTKSVPGSKKLVKCYHLV